LHNPVYDAQCGEGGQQARDKARISATMGMSKSLWEQHGLSCHSENGEKGDHAKRPLEARMKRFLRRMIDLFLPSAGIYANPRRGR
jgi:hypothetical protein